MSITLQLTPDEERALRQAAATEGKDVSTYIRHQIFFVAPNVSSHNLALSDLSFFSDALVKGIPNDSRKPCSLRILRKSWIRPDSIAHGRRHIAPVR